MTTPEERIRAAMAEAANKAAEIFASDHAVAAAGLQAGLCALYRELAWPEVKLGLADLSDAMTQWKRSKRVNPTFDEESAFQAGYAAAVAAMKARQP
jgi:hypothetical protein